ncbi:MAG: fibrobacter succinogenes major paralogous domain-containing protein [Bacteroidaceae bacterium]|nr:fibrobacter succinogenes major paralogous domain-containing protein [Bacteroidaceae bacterium]
MKTKVIVAAALIAFGVTAASAQTMVVNLANGSKMEFKTSEVTNVEFKEAENKEDKPDNPVIDDGQFANGHEYVDLDLPSGTLWATMNVGAESPEDYGNYYAWGETKAYGEEDTSNAHNYSYNGNSSYKKTVYDWSTYKWCSASNSRSFTKYNTNSNYGTVDNKKVLELADDAAYVNWGENWRMPTDAEMQELKSNCTWTWTSINGNNGYKVYSKKDSSKYIFLPAAGYRGTGSLSDFGSYGYFWSSSLKESYPYGACYLRFYSSLVDWNFRNRYCGQSVRPVRRQ